MQGGATAIHGGRVNDSRIYADGINMGWAGTGGGGGQMPQVASAQEVVMTISGGLGEAETSGLIFNAIPREGANKFSGQFNYSGSGDSLQGSNYTQELQQAGLRAPFTLLSVYDVSGMYGGRIVQDKLWFYGTYRQVGGERTVPGMFHNKNAGNPNSWVVDFDRTQQAFNNSLERQATIRLTWQASPRNKFNFHWAEQYNDAQLRQRRRRRDGTRRKRRPACSTSHRVNRTRPGSRRSRASCSPRPAGACIRPGTASVSATTTRSIRR